MKRSKQLTGALLGVAVVALIVAGCGSSNNDSSSSSASSSGPYGASTKTVKSSSGAAKVSMTKSDIGRTRVGTKGRRFYLFEKKKSPKSPCWGACAAAWPPLTTSGQPTAGTGVSAAKLSTTKRADGTKQVVYNGHPLYYYAGDTKAGQT